MSEHMKHIVSEFCFNSNMRFIAMFASAVCILFAYLVVSKYGFETHMKHVTCNNKAKYHLTMGADTKIFYRLKDSSA